MAEHKYYLVVGGSSGIGLETAKQLSENGNRVVLVSGNEHKLATAVKELDGEGHLAIHSDLRHPSGVDDIFKALQEERIVLNGMVYSAGISPLCLLKDNDPELMEQVFSVNVFSFIEMVKYFYQDSVSACGSRIVAVASIAAHSAGYRQTLYGASKAAMISAVKLMARELLNRDIRINCISPGAVDAPMLDKLRQGSSNLDEKIKLSQPLGVISAKDVASTICHLLGKGSDFCTGAEIVLDGGANLK